MTFNIGVVGLKDGWSSLKLLDAFKTNGSIGHLIEMDQVSSDLMNDRVTFNELNLEELDALVVKKVSSYYSPDILNRLEILRHLEKKGVKIYPAPEAIMEMINRMNCILRLQEGGIPMPPTVITENVDEVVEKIKEYKKAVLKPLYTSKARGMRFVDAADDVRKEVEEFKAEGNAMIFAQKAVDIPGQDLGVVFLGDDYLCTYARVGSNDSWNTTINSGGKYMPYEPSQEVIELARKAKNLFKLEFTCVDVVETSEGPMVFEVSAFGGYRGIVEANKLDAADLVAKHILKRMNNESAKIN